MSESESKKLSELRVVDLRAELEKRGLDKNGVKKDLVERLQKALQGEGVDSESHNFDLGDKKLNKRLSTSSSSYQGDESMSEKAESESEKAEKNSDKQHDEGGQKQQSPEKKDKTEGAAADGQEARKKQDTQKEPAEKENDKNDQEPEISLSLEEEEKINVEGVDADEEAAENKKSSSDETASKEGQADVSKESTSSSQEVSKKNQAAEAGGTSNGAVEESGPTKKSNANPKLLWITNVPKNTRANEIKQLLSSCGKVVCAKVVVNARFPGSCCFGYVSMATAEDAANVITKLNNTEFNGQIIKIDKFENINSISRKKAEENRKHSEKNEDKSPDGKSEQGTNLDKDKPESHFGPERRSMTSDRSSRSRRRSSSRERFRPIHRPEMRGYRANVLTFDKIKEERERQRLRDRERAQREDSRRRHEEAVRLREMREISRRQRNEAERLEREREKLRQERDRIEREKGELIKLERERQRIEREKIEMEKMELQRSRMRLEEDRRAVKRPLPVPYRREENFEERKRPANERHFEETSRFEPPPHASQIPPKKIAPPKDFKRMPYKHETFSSENRDRDFNSERSQHTPSVNRTNTSLKYDRFDNVRGREIREAPSRETQSNVSMRAKEPRFGGDRERSSPHFRNMQENRERHVPTKDKEHFSESNVSERWNPGPPQSKFGSNTQKPWSAKGGTWRSDPPSLDSSRYRWNSNSGSGRSSMNQQFSGNSNMAPVCPPPPGINNYSDRFEYNKSSGIRKY